MDARLALIAELLPLAGFGNQAVDIRNLQEHVVDRRDASGLSRHRHLTAGMQDDACGGRGLFDPHGQREVAVAERNGLDTRGGTGDGKPLLLAYGYLDSIFADLRIVAIGQPDDGIVHVRIHRGPNDLLLRSILAPIAYVFP